MMDLPTIEDLQQAIDHLQPSSLRTLLDNRLADTVSCGLQELTHVLVVEAGDRESDIEHAVGFTPLATRIDGIRNQPDWDWLEYHDGWWELLYTVGNSGFAYILFVEDVDGSPLAEFCRKHVGRAA